LKDTVSLSVQVISPNDDDVAAVNAALRDAGHAATCTKCATTEDFETGLAEGAPDLIVLFDETGQDKLGFVNSKRNEYAQTSPLLIVANYIDETCIAAAMQGGARDVVSLDNIERFKAVASRELRSMQLEKALANVMRSAKQYKHELTTLKQITVEAIADIQEGIIVHANPAWLELFGFTPGEDLTGYPIMDLCVASARPALKGGLVACQHGKWHADKLMVNGQRHDGSEFPVEFHLEKITHDDDLAIRLVVQPEHQASADSTPEVIVEAAFNQDPVTGMYTRQEFLSRTEERLRTQAQGGVRAFGIIRPDKFSKALNDVGIMGSEKIIRQIAQLLRELLQPGDIFGRFGGTTFALLLERGNMTDVEAWAELFIKNVASTVFDHDNHSTVVTCSVGVTEILKSRPNWEAALLECEQSCSIARQKGGNRIEQSEAHTVAQTLDADDAAWGPRIRAALTENRMRLEHQPIGSLNEDIEDAYDTLVRMVDEDGNTILPSEFMPAAERSGLSKSIDRWVIGASLSFCKANQVDTVFVRLSRDSLLDKTLPDWLAKKTTETGISPKKICFEISEDIVLTHLRQATDLATELNKLRFSFAVEHFGMLDDSSHILNIVPMNYVKIDGSLMQGLHKDPGLQSKVKQLVAEARQKTIYSIAERVQDANTMAVLWQLGVSYIQGNYVQNREIVIESMGTATMKAVVLEGIKEPSL
jgi:diguanylate cyclase (GGDEF)-like protein/PAS domain S-box-containing protein